MRRQLVATLLTLSASGALATVVEANTPSLRGSRAAMVQQNQVAKEHGLNFYRTPAQITAAVESGELLPLEGNENYEVADFVRFPFAQPAAKLFVERLSAQYRDACGQKLVVTSAVRPQNGQPRNAHALSVHPAGMALDLRVSDRASCRSWLESALMNLEARGVLNGIREFSPPHYHVALYPVQYMAYAEERMAEEAELAAAQAEADAAAAAAAAEAAAAVAAAAPAIHASADGLPFRAMPVMATLVALLALPLGHRALQRRRWDDVGVCPEDRAATVRTSSEPN